VDHRLPVASAVVSADLVAFSIRNEVIFIFRHSVVQKDMAVRGKATARASERTRVKFKANIQIGLRIKANEKVKWRASER
jgi:hypothetical protein